MKQTAVNWLVEQIKSDQNQKALSASEWMKVIEQAKDIEKQQIMDAWANGEGYNDEEAKEMAKKYYKETYESNNDI